jgi:hypothetical protein
VTAVWNDDLPTVRKICELARRIQAHGVSEYRASEDRMYPFPAMRVLVVHGNTRRALGEDALKLCRKVWKMRAADRVARARPFESALCEVRWPQNIKASLTRLSPPWLGRDARSVSLRLGSPKHQRMVHPNRRKRADPLETRPKTGRRY